MEEIANDVYFLNKKENQTFFVLGRVDEVAGGRKLLLGKPYLKNCYSFPEA